MDGGRDSGGEECAASLAALLICGTLTLPSLPDKRSQLILLFLCKWPRIVFLSQRGLWMLTLQGGGGKHWSILDRTKEVVLQREKNYLRMCNVYEIVVWSHLNMHICNICVCLPGPCRIQIIDRRAVFGSHSIHQARGTSGVPFNWNWYQTHHLVQWSDLRYPWHESCRLQSSWWTSSSELVVFNGSHSEG